MADAVSFIPNEDDFVDAHAAMFARALRGRRFWVGYIMFLALWTVSLVVFAGALSGMSMTFPQIASLAIKAALVVGAYLLFLNFNAMRQRGRRLFRQRRANPETLMSWDDSGVTWKTERGFIHINWDEFHTWSVSKYSYLLHDDDDLFRFVPRRVLTPAQDQDLHAHLEASGVGRR